MKSKDIQPSKDIEREIKSFPDKKNQKEFVNVKPVLDQMLKGLLQEKKRKKNETEENSLTIKWHYICTYQ